jgi:hypothetical protein
MSKDTYRWDSPQSSAIWKKEVIKRRGAFSARLKLARRTSGNGSLSWPTTAARDYKGTSPNYSTRKDGKSRADQLAVAVDLEERATWPTPTVQEAGKIGNQANHGQLALSNHPAIRGEVSRKKYEKGKHGQAAPASSSSLGSRQGLWLTPRANEPTGDSTFVTRNGDRGQHCSPSLTIQVEKTPQWMTPRACEAQNPPMGVDKRHHGLTHQVTKQWATPRSGKTTDENPETWALRQAKGDVATMPLGAQVKMWPTASVPNGGQTTSGRADKDTKKQVRLEHAVAQWGTPAANDANKQNVMCEVNSKQAGLPKSVGLELQRQWSTPNARDPKGAQGRMAKLGQMSDLPSQTEVAPTGQWNRANGKLNPRWVEALMGLPIGWTMPSCTSPQTIAPMSCDSSAMESACQPLSVLGEFSLAS